MLKRISAVAVVVAMLVTMLCAFSVGYAEGEMTITLTPSAVKVLPGETVTVTVGIQNYKPVAGLTIVNEIDSAKLEYVSSESKNWTESMPFTNANESDEPTNGTKALHFTNPNYNAGNDGYRRIRSTWASGNNIKTAEFNFDIWTVTYTVPEDASLGKTEVKFKITEAFAWDDALNNTVSLLGTDVREEEVTLDLEIYNGDWGDVNNDKTVDAKDVVMILRYNAQLLAYEDLKCPEAADVWEDGKINLKDAILILRHIVG